MIAHWTTRRAHARLVSELGPDTAPCFGLDIAGFSLDASFLGIDVVRWVQIYLFRLFDLRGRGDVRLALGGLRSGIVGRGGGWIGRGW